MRKKTAAPQDQEVAPIAPGEEPTEALEANEEPAEEGDDEPGGNEDVGDEADDDEPPPPPPARQPQTADDRPIKKLPTGHMPLPVVALGDPRLALDATTLAEAAICAAVFRVLADNAAAIVAAILAADEELPPFVMDDEDRDLLAALFARDTAIAARIRMAAGTTPRDAITA